jgi:hypothetical protein
VVKTIPTLAETAPVSLLIKFYPYYYFTAKVTGEQRKLHNGELHNLYSSPDIIRQIKSRRMRWVGYVARMGGGRKCTGFLWESQKEDQGVDGRMGSKWTLGRSAGGGGVEWIHLAQDRDRWQAVVNAVMNLRVVSAPSWLHLRVFFIFVDYPRKHIFQQTQIIGSLLYTQQPSWGQPW